MSEVKRYDPMGYDRLSGYMQQHPEGDYVRHADYAALEAECERLRQFEIAYNDWQAKTDWVQESAKPHELGRHRADVLRARIEALAAELAAIKGQEPVAFYWQDIGYPEPRTHGPYFGQPSESALRNVDGRAIPVLLYTLPPASHVQE